MNRKAIPKDRKVLSLEDKIRLLDHYKETKCSIRKLAKLFNIGKSQAGFIVKQEQILYQHWLSGNTSLLARKRLSNVGFEIDQKIYDWYLAKKTDNQDVTGPALQRKALELAKDLGYDSFKASNGWLAKFVKRHGIFFKEPKNRDQSINKEKTSDLNIDLDEWSKILHSIIDKYSDDDIFSAVQTGLFFKTVPDSTCFLLDRTCVDGALSAERLTVLLYASMSGKKEKPLVVTAISKKDIENFELIEVDYKSNSFAWLTKDIMNEWLMDLNDRMKEQRRNIVILLDHSLPLHDCQLSNVRAIYFPTISLNNRRINQGIIQNFKVFYRLLLLTHLIAQKRNDLNNILPDHMIDVPQALTWINLSWKELSPNVIHKCFEEIFFNVVPDNVCDEEASVTLNNVSDLLCVFGGLINVADYVSIDDCLVTEGECPKSVETVEYFDDAYSEGNEENSDESKNVVSNKDISNFYYESLKDLKRLEEFYELQNDSNGLFLVKQLISHHENVISSKNVYDEC